MTETIIEACVSSLPECILAQKNGANQLELCSRLDLDGLTPDLELIKSAKKAVDIPIKVMIRPREGDFCYTLMEKALIRKQISDCKKIEVGHFVYGSIKAGRLDIEDILAVYNYIASENYPIKSYTIHKAIDVSSNPLEDLRILKDRFAEFPIKLAILSSGSAPKAMEGADLLNEMIALAEDSIEIIVAGKVTSENMTQVMKAIPARSYHGRRIVPLK